MWNENTFKYKLTFSNNFMMNRELNLRNILNVIRNYFEHHVLIFWYLTLLVRVR